MRGSPFGLLSVRSTLFSNRDGTPYAAWEQPLTFSKTYYVDNGDPYFAHCVETVRLLRERLNLEQSKLTMTFQSRFGRGKWLEPATNLTLKQLAKSGVKNIAVVTPGFSADCLETLEEIAIEGERIFKKYGGENFAAIPCLNDSAPGMLVIWQMALRELKGWV